MTMPFYVAPEQVMKDRAEYAQKGIARGRSLVACVYDDGILVVAENPSRSLHKVSEIYDRIAFAGVGKYNEFDQLRVAGVRHADTKGFAFSREDVDARSLANLYAQFLGQVFTHEMKPLEVEILVAELGADGKPDQLYHIAYEGTITDEDRFAVLGGETETISDRVAESYRGRLGPRRRPAGGGGRPGGARPDPRARRPRGGRAVAGQRPARVPPAGPRGAGRAPERRSPSTGRASRAAPGRRPAPAPTPTPDADGGPPALGVSAGARATVSAQRRPADSSSRSSKSASTWSASRSSRASSGLVDDDEHLDRPGQGIGPVAGRRAAG